MPVENDPALEAAQAESETGHRVRVVDVDDVVFVLVLLEPGYHLRGNHRGGQFPPGLDADHASVSIQMDDFILLEFSAEHVTVNPACGQTAREIPHDFFHATPDGVELTELEYFHPAPTA